MQLVDDFWTGDGDSSDSNSIDQNNTSAFCYRMVTGGGNLSNHAYGRAIDLNPQQDPYVWYNSSGQASWSHQNANAYIDRSCGLIRMRIPCREIPAIIFSQNMVSAGAAYGEIRLITSILKRKPNNRKRVYNL